MLVTGPWSSHWARMEAIVGPEVYVELRRRLDS
jgi:hypothetical protein